MSSGCADSPLDSVAFPDVTFGVYVHIPFCAARCDYCAFATWTDRAELMEQYCRAVTREVRDADLPPASTVFFGGGTPSLLPSELLISILEAIERTGDAEVTVECNPESVDAAKLVAYRAAGVNRLSFGVQSMAPHVLAALGRRHDPAAVVAAFGAARAAGFVELNADLILGAAGESLDDWRRTLDAVLALHPTSVSAYSLTVEAGTPLALDPSRYPDDDDQADKYLLADHVLTAAGLVPYEVSNWARPGSECRHNLLYWEQGDYRGVGCAAHSHERGRRWWNIRTPERYIAAIDGGVSPVAAGETLDPAAVEAEALQLLLRTNRGVPRAALPVEDLAGLVEERGDRVVLTASGRLLANEVAARLR